MGRTTSAPHICRDRPVLADTGCWPWQLFGFGVDWARRPRWGTVSRTKGCVVCLAAWRSTTVAEHPSVIQGLRALDPAGLRAREFCTFVAASRLPLVPDG